MMERKAVNLVRLIQRNSGEDISIQGLEQAREFKTIADAIALV